MGDSSASATSTAVVRTRSRLAETERLVRSKQRVADHGEVFTPAWLVEDMLDLVGDETARVDSRVLEPACGSGNFLVPALLRKLKTVQVRYGVNVFERNHNALLALMCIYGIELLPDNAEECRHNLLETFCIFLGTNIDSEYARAAAHVLAFNIVEGDALSMKSNIGETITFPEWGYLGKGKFQRRDFRFEDLTQRASYEGTLFGEMEEHDLFVPLRSYSPMTVKELAQ